MHRSKPRVNYCLLLLCSFLFTKLGAQSFSFEHLNTSNGLSDNNIRCMAVDKAGFLWIGTTDGLNVYDGYSTTVYYKDREPNIASNNIIHLMADSRGRIWLGSSQGVTWIDGKRNFNRIKIQDTLIKFICPTILETKSYGNILYTNFGQFYLDSVSNKWKKLDWIPEKLRYAKFMDAEPLGKDRVVYCMDSLVAIVDYQLKKITFEYTVNFPVSACRVSDQEIAIGIQTGKIIIVNTTTRKVVKEHQLTNEFDGKMVNTNLSEVRQAANGDLLIATGFSGLINIDAAGKITTYTHDPIAPGSVSSNNTYRVLPLENGDVIVGTNTSGVNIFNIFNRQAGYIPIFKDDKGALFDNFLDDLAEDKKGMLWIGAYDRLIRWDRKTNKSKYFFHYLQTQHQGLRRLEIRALCFDNYGKLWVSAIGDGIATFDEKTGKFTKLTQDTSLAPALRSYYVHDLAFCSDGMVWACTNTGIYSIDPLTHKINTFLEDSLLKKVARKRTITIFEDRSKRIWLSTTGDGVYCYDKKNQTLQHYTDKDGLVSNTAYGFKQDRRGNIYAGSQVGFSIISPGGKIKTYTRSSGLRYDRIEAFVEDDKGFMWMANNKCLMRYDPIQETMEFFDEKASLSVYGFRFDCALKSKTGELFFGSERGLNYFFTDQLANDPAQVKLNIFKATLPDTVVRFDGNATLKLPYSKNDIQLGFGAINLRGSKNILYEYKLEGHDKEWRSGVDLGHTRYTSLSPGTYIFRVRASTDRKVWIKSANEVKIIIVPPLWQQWWFIGSILAFITGVIYWVIAGRNKKIIEQREEIETEQAISYFASSMSEHQTEENILWDVARNCIGRLNFEDCVIYLMDEQKGKLVQMAAHGPKSPKQFEIDKPISIRPGEGIVGSVALTGKAEIIPDTTRDPRYIVDDERRYSEISVPMISDGKVLGVIDCEHSKKRFFTQKHLSILTTIASLCANKITRARAEEDKKEAQMILMSTQQKMTEVEMQALRAQMNPHFIFNCLNSINRYIVKSDQTTASLYLTKFAKLIRLILDNSNSKDVILTNELEALKLYIEMEALRFDKKFTYEIKTEPNLGSDSIEVPPLIIQPYVENAIWHGLLHKENNGHLSIRLRMVGESMLECVIEDNGVGRDKAKELRSKSATSRKSLGMQLTENRLSLLNKHAQLNASVEIIDLENNERQAAGTKVILMIPV